MTVFVDDMRASYGRLLLSHMIADSVGELHAMACRIGIGREHFQATHSGPHYDVCQVKRAIAIVYGAREITMRQCAAMMSRWRSTGSLGAPAEAIAWLRQRRCTLPGAQPVPMPDDLKVLL